MKKFILIFLIISIITSVFTISVNAEEVIEVTEEVVIEKTTNELLSDLIEKIEITNFILLFMIIIHYVEKWLKLFVSGFDPHLN